MNESSDLNLEWLVTLPNAWGKADNLDQALKNALVHFRPDRHDGKVTMWYGRVNPNDFEVTMYGEIHSSKIEGDVEQKVKVDELKYLDDVLKDIELFVDDLLDPGKSEVNIVYPESDLMDHVP